MKLKKNHKSYIYVYMLHRFIIFFDHLEKEKGNSFIKVYMYNVIRNNIEMNE